MEEREQEDVTVAFFVSIKHKTHCATSQRENMTQISKTKNTHLNQTLCIKWDHSLYKIHRNGRLLFYFFVRIGDRYDGGGEIPFILESVLTVAPGI